MTYLELIGAGMSPEPIENGKQIVAGCKQEKLSHHPKRKYNFLLIYLYIEQLTVH